MYNHAFVLANVLLKSRNRMVELHRLADQVYYPILTCPPCILSVSVW